MCPALMIFIDMHQPIDTNVGADRSHNKYTVPAPARPSSGPTRQEAAPLASRCSRKSDTRESLTTVAPSEKRRAFATAFKDTAISICKAVLDIAYMCVEVPKALYNAAPFSFLVLSATSILAGALEFAGSKAGAIYGVVLFARQDLCPPVALLGLLNFAETFISIIQNYQARLGSIATAKNGPDRLIRGIQSQNLAQLSNEKFTNSVSLAHTNQWVPFNLGEFFFPIIREVTRFAFIGIAMTSEASGLILACVAGMTIPSIITTTINTYVSNRDEREHANSTGRGCRLTDLLSAIEYMRGIRIDGAAGALQQERDSCLSKGMAANRRQAQIAFYLDTVSGLVSQGSKALAFWFIGIDAMAGTIKLEQALLLTAVLPQLSKSVSGIFNSLVRLKLTAPYLRAIREIEKTVDTPPSAEETFFNADTAPAIRLNNAIVTNPGSQRTLLENISIIIEAGKVTALWGPQGCGKTTLLDVLAGLRAPKRADQIQAIIGDEVRNLADVHPNEWLRSFGYCPQKPQIYTGLTLRRNIVLNVPEDSTTPQAESEFINELLAFIGKPEWGDKLDIPIGEGVGQQNFSGGELQLIALARALFKRPKLLFLDEAFTGVPELFTAQLLTILKKHELDRLIGVQPTVVMVTHDSRVLRYADKIVGLDPKTKSVFAEGPYQTLFETCEQFKRQVNAFQGVVEEEREKDRIRIAELETALMEARLKIRVYEQRITDANE